MENKNSIRWTTDPSLPLIIKNDESIIEGISGIKKLER
jgi:hypothetical protein